MIYSRGELMRRYRRRNKLALFSSSLENCHDRLDLFLDGAT